MTHAAKIIRFIALLLITLTLLIPSTPYVSASEEQCRWVTKCGWECWSILDENNNVVGQHCSFKCSPVFTCSDEDCCFWP